MCGAKSQLGFFGGAGSATPPLFFFYVNEMTRSSPVSFEKKNIDHFLSLHECTEEESLLTVERAYFHKTACFSLQCVVLGVLPFFFFLI